MALDPSIILAGKPVQIESPLTSMGKMMQVRGQMAEIALRNQQIEASKAQAADIAEQAASRRRANEAQTKLTGLLADPTVHEQIRSGDLSPLFNAGLPPDAVTSAAEGLNKFYKTTGELHDADVMRHAKGRELAAAAFTDVDPNDPNAASQLNSFKTSIAGDYPQLAQQMPTFVQGPGLAQQVDDFKHSNAIFAAVLNSEQSQRKAQGEIAAKDAETLKANAETDKFKQDVLTARANLPKIEADAAEAKLLSDFRAKNGGRSPAEVETGRHNQRTEAVQSGELGLKQKTFDATFGSGLDADGRPLSPSALKEAAEQDPVAKAIAEYRSAPPPAQTRGGVPSPILRKVMAINPQYDATTYPARSKTATDFSPAGKSGQAITAADTALAHLNTLSESGAALKNGDIQKLNQLANFLGAQTGATAKGTYDAIQNMVAPEISKAVLGVAGGEHERENTSLNYGSNLSDAQRESNIAATVGLLGARFDKSAHAYESEMGHSLPRSLSPESQAIRQKYTKGKPSGVQPIALKDGTFLNPHDSAAADRFRKDHPDLIK